MLSPASESAYARWTIASVRAAMLAGQARAKARVIAGEGFLYVAEIIGTPLLKIGHALDPQKRMRTLGTGEGGRCRLLATTPGSRLDEGRLHRALREHAIISRPNWRASERYPRSILLHPAIPYDLRPDIFGEPPKRKRAA